MDVMAVAENRRYRQELVADPREFARVRRTLTARLVDWGRSGIAASAVLCATELLANVHRHTGGDCVLLLEETPHGVRLTVSDTSPAPPRVYQPDWLSENGRGMWLLSCVAYDWGVRATPTGKDVWAEVRPDDSQFTPPSGDGEAPS